MTDGGARLRRWVTRVALAGVALFAAGQALAQWTRFEAVPATDVYSVEVQGDTLLAGVERGAWISVNGGSSWTRTADLPTPPVSVEVSRLTGGRLWCGTFGQGVYTSTNMGASWQELNTGLAGGIGGSHFFVLDLETRGDSVYAATDGAGVFVIHRLAPVAWAPLGTQLLALQAGGVADLAHLDGRLLALGGANGQVFHNDRGESDWTESLLGNTVLLPGLQPRRAAWTGTRWLVSTQQGCYRGDDGESPWTHVGPADGSAVDGLVVADAHRSFVVLNSLAATRYRFSPNDGLSWQALEIFPGYTYELALHGGRLLAGRLDGLWARETATLTAPPAATTPGIRLALVGPHPVTDVAHLRWSMANAGPVRLEVYDLRGARVAQLRDEVLGPGAHEARWRVSGVPSGMYIAHLETVGGRTATRIAVVR